jgi:hypothetical protein
MSKYLKWLIPIFILLAAVSAALAQDSTSLYYFPLVFKSKPTPTPTATVTPTPTKTPKPTITPTPTINVHIDDIIYDPEDNELDEYVLIKNGSSSKTYDMTGWLLRDEDPNNKFFFPDFDLGPKKSVKVWSKAGFNDSSNLYWGRTEEEGDVWNDVSDCAYLRDGIGPESILIDSYCYRKSFWSIFGLFP